MTEPLKPENYYQKWTSSQRGTIPELLITLHTLPIIRFYVFSCALLELWSEGTAPFEFSQLLAYRAGEMELVKKHLSGIQNDNLAKLISSMISLNPEDRKSAEIYLDEERGRLFPDYFYTFLQPYLQIFSSNPVLPPDEKMLIMHQDINQLLNVCSYLDEMDNVRGTDNDGLILAIGTVTSCIRGLQHSKSRLRALEILRRLAEHTTSETILDRILPYIVSNIDDRGKYFIKKSGFPWEREYL